MRTLIAVTTCHKRRDQADAQRTTWAEGCKDVRFFIGGGEPERPDEVVLNVDDSYQGLPQKVQGACHWALDNGYDRILKLDDDVYVVMDRLIKQLTDESSWQEPEYIGNFRMRNGNYPADYASGFAYLLSGRALMTIAKASFTCDTMEDRWVGNTLEVIRPRIQTFDEKRFTCPYPTGVEAPQKLWGSFLGRQCLIIGQYPAAKIFELHTWYKRCFDVISA